MSDSRTFGNLIHELRRRHVARAGIVYVGAALLVLFVASQARRAEVLPEAVFAALELLAGIGLPVTLALAWRSGAREGSGGEPDRATRRAGAWALALVTVAAAGPAALTAWGDLASRPHGEPLLTEDTFPADVRWEPDPLRVAVLPLDDRTGVDSLRYLARGLTEQLIADLGRMAPVTVVPATAVRAVVEGRVTVAALTAGLGVGLLLDGRVEQGRGRRRVVYQLASGTGGDTVATDTVTGPVGRPLALYDSLLTAVTGSLARHLGVTARPVPRPAGVTERAWTLVHRAETVIDRAIGDGTTAGGRAGAEESGAVRGALDRADSLLALAETAAPQWVGPILRRGWLEQLRARYTADEPGTLEATPLLRGLGYAERALVLRPGNRPAALELRGMLRRGLATTMGPGGGRSRMLRLARQDLTEAVEERPDLARAWWALGEVLRAEGAREAAGRADRRALLENPYLEQAPGLYHRLFRAALEDDDHASADHWCREGRRRFPDDPDLALCRLLLEASVDSIPADPRLAHAAAESALAVAAAADTAELRAYADLQLAKVFARVGRRDSAEAYVRRAHGGTFRPHLAYDEAHVRLILGQPDSALALLEIAADRAPEQAGRWPRDPWLRRLWDDPRFLRLVESARN